MTQTSTTAVATSVVVDAPIERAFAVFTDDIGSWWPPEHHLLSSFHSAVAVVSSTLAAAALFTPLRRTDLTGVVHRALEPALPPWPTRLARSRRPWPSRQTPWKTTAGGSWLSSRPPSRARREPSKSSFMPPENDTCHFHDGRHHGSIRRCFLKSRPEGGQQAADRRFDNPVATARSLATERRRPWVMGRPEVPAGPFFG